MGFTCVVATKCFALPNLLFTEVIHSVTFTLVAGMFDGVTYVVTQVVQLNVTWVVFTVSTVTMVCLMEGKTLMGSVNDSHGTKSLSIRSCLGPLVLGNAARTKFNVEETTDFRHT